MISGEPCPIFVPRTTWALPIAFATILLTSIWAARKVLPLRARNLRKGTCASCSILCRTTLLPTIPGPWSIPNTSLPGTLTTPRMIQRLHHDQWAGFCLRERPIFPGMAGCAAIECLSARPSPGCGRHHFQYCPPVRWDSLRHGNALAQLRVRTNMGPTRRVNQPATEYWADVIPTIKKVHPDFLFIAEAYWDLECSFNSKASTSAMTRDCMTGWSMTSAESVRLHLCADLGYQEKLLRFIENHDEPRAASTFSPAKERAAAVTTSTLPGARLFHEGQFEGRKIRVPVFLGTAP